ncbi:hypothetical protein HID58_002273, partial [Brassica napus]
MVSSQIADYPEEDDGDGGLPIPKMMFAAGEELGLGFLIYFKLSRGRQNPYITQVTIRKKHEAWFRFTEKPIRLSFREFTIVTSLNCAYWPWLFGKVEDLRISTSLKMLRRKTFTEKDVRINLACFAIVSSVLLEMKMIKNMQRLWEISRNSFLFRGADRGLKCLCVRDDVSLSQNTIAVKGFALALQLVMVEAVPSLTEVVLETCSSSESDSCDEDDDFLQKKMKKQTLSHGHAREVDQKTEVFDLSPTFQFLYSSWPQVRSIIPEDPDRPIEAGTLVWADEVVDVEVDNLDKRIAAIVLLMLKPEVERVVKEVSSAEETTSKLASYQANVMGSIDNLLMNFKEDVIRSVTEMH